MFRLFCKKDYRSNKPSVGNRLTMIIAQKTETKAVLLSYVPIDYTIKYYFLYYFSGYLCANNTCAATKVQHIL